MSRMPRPVGSRTFPDAVPVLSDGVVTLRAHRRADVDAIVEQCSDPDTMRWTTVPRPYRKADALRFLAHVKQSWDEPCGTRYWAIEWTDEAGCTRFAGSLDLRPHPGRVAEIGFGLHPAARGDGVMARAVRLLATHAFSVGLDEGPLERIHWSALVGNFASWRVAWATGFVFHGTLPRWGAAQPDGQGGLEARDHWAASLSAHAPMVPSTTWLEVPVLEANGIRLRPWREDDADHTESMAAGPAHHMPAGAAPDDLTFDHWLLVRRERAARGEAIVWCVADARSDQPLGAVLVFSRSGPISEAGAELG